MNKLFFIAIIFLGLRGSAQDCPPSPDIADNYLIDAEILALREIYDDSLHEFSDSVWIPKDLVNKYLGLLSSIYLLDTDLTGKIFNTYTIHVFPDIPYMEISMIVDTSLTWIKAFLKDSLISGNPEFDSIISSYGFRLSSYFHFNSFTSMRIQTANVLNLNPVVHSLIKFSGLSNVSAETSWYGDGDDIRFSYINDTSYFEFSKGWGDCPSGCDQRQYWKFSVFECSSSFINTYGDIYTDNQEVPYMNLLVYPNPFDDFVSIYSDKTITEINIYSISGRMIKTITPDYSVINLSFLDKGVYIF